MFWGYFAIFWGYLRISSAGDIEIGGIGSHGEPWNSPWQYQVPLMQASNITIKDLFVTGGDDNGKDRTPLSSSSFSPAL